MIRRVILILVGGAFAVAATFFIAKTDLTDRLQCLVGDGAQTPDHCDDSSATGEAGPSATPEPESTSTTAPAARSDDENEGTLGDLHAELVVMPRPSQPGYDRECGSGDSCVFGPAWTDDHTADLGRDDCDTRNNILARDLEDVTYRPDTENCEVEAGTLDEPFTGERIHFEKSSGADVHIDHIYPLARAWDMGADEWPEERRVAFANDPANLIAVDGGANQSKSDQGPGEWMPSDVDFACEYLTVYATVAVTYDLPVTPETHTVILEHASTCP